MERVDYFFPDTDDLAACEGKFEAILDAVSGLGAKSEVVPGGDTRRVSIWYADGERSLIEPTVLVVVRNTDSTYWAISEKAVFGISQTDIRNRLQDIGLTVGVMHMTRASGDTTITTAVQASPEQWKTILAALEKVQA